MNDALTWLWEAQLRHQAAQFPLSSRRNQRTARGRSVALLDDLFYDLTRLAAPDLFVDAGAFDGDASLRAAETVPGLRIFAFEANPLVFRHFSSTTDFSERGVHYVNRALADSHNSLTFYLETAEDGANPLVGYSSLLRRNSDKSVSWQPGTPVTPIQVDAAPLDDLVPETRVCSLWLDVEGGLEGVLSGAARVLAACVVLKVEVESEPLWEGQWLSPDVTSALINVGLVPVARDVQAEAQYNVVWARPELINTPQVARLLARFHLESKETPSPAWLGRLRATGWYGTASRHARRLIS